MLNTEIGQAPEDPRIIIAKLDWSEYYQGEKSTGHFSEGDEYFERYNFRRCRVNNCDALEKPCSPIETRGEFYGNVPRTPPTKANNQKWLLVFIAFNKEAKRHCAVGWYEDATFVDYAPPHPPHPAAGKGEEYLTCTIKATMAHLLPCVIRKYFEVPSRLMTHFGMATHVYARGPGAEDGECWRKEFAEFALGVKYGMIDPAVLAAMPAPTVQSVCIKPQSPE